MSSVRITTSGQLEKLIANYQGVLVVECHKHYSGPFFLMRPVLQQLTRMFNTELMHCRIDLDENKPMSSVLQISVELAYLVFHQGECIAQIEGMIPLLDFMNAMEEHLFEIQEIETIKNN